MKTIKIYGASDDLIEVEGSCKGCDEYNAGGTGPLMGVIHLTTEENAVHVHCIYDGAWSFGVSPQDVEGDDWSVMPWPMRRKYGIPVQYSETLEIDVPDDCEVSYV